MKGSYYKKLTHEDKLDRYYACWVKNNRKAWRWCKRQNRKEFRRKWKSIQTNIFDAEVQ